jgi:hypothetical protein
MSAMIHYHPYPAHRPLLSPSSAHKINGEVMFHRFKSLFSIDFDTKVKSFISENFSLFTLIKKLYTKIYTLP